ncbi:hypothetical protein [Modestobacter italicus]|uniref:hypothetical protein n=1 Tax=Modestobacter italicus (strain DSM 44449 / CECT 9708 / BC 501) TaxID=2732864 RepID=UPI001E32ACB0|nr:hypothetical protein [Modestobacter marinus]
MTGHNQDDTAADARSRPRDARVIRLAGTAADRGPESLVFLRENVVGDVVEEPRADRHDGRAHGAHGH